MDSEQYKEVFDLEIEGWCYGLATYPGEHFPELVHAVIREMKPSFARAIEYQHPFNLISIGDKLADACKFAVPEKELVFSMLAQLPSPYVLKAEDQMYTLAQILDFVEQQYPGAIERLERRWKGTEPGHGLQ
jgi:hypothetical protein